MTISGSPRARPPVVPLQDCVSENWATLINSSEVTITGIESVDVS